MIPKLSHLQRQALEYVAIGERPWSFNRRTVRSLETLGLIEHTSTGWRLTQLGCDVVEKK